MEKDFSIKKFCRYVLGRWPIAVACLVVGIICGAIYAVAYHAPSYEVYAGSLEFDSEAYYAVINPTGEKPGEGDYAKNKDRFEQLVNFAKNAADRNDVYAKAVADYGDKIYPRDTKEEKRREKFFADLTVRSDNSLALRVSFAYDVRSDEDREFARSVVAYSLDLAEAGIKARASEISESSYPKVVSRSEIKQDIDPENVGTYIELSKQPSMLVSLVVGLLGGAVLAVIAAAVLYCIDPRVKSLAAYADPRVEALATVKNASDGAELLELMAAAMPKGGLLLLSPGNGDADKLAEEIAGASGVRFVSADKLTAAELSEALGKGVAIRAYGGTDRGMVSYLASDCEQCVLLLRQRTVREKDFVDVALAAADSGCKPTGTLVYDTGSSWLD